LQINPSQYNTSYDGLNATTPVDTYSDSTVGYRYLYDDDDNLLRTIDPDGNVTRYVYDTYGNLIQQINPSQYDSNDDGLSESTPNNSYNDSTVGYRYTYFDSGSVETITTPDNSVFTFTTDDAVSTQVFGSVTNTSFVQTMTGL
jgi:YD repeat-containing protein